MAYLKINKAQIFYKCYGKPSGSEIPVLLIHGSTITGQIDWGLIAPLLARHRLVIVPDCRGHGRSENPDRNYSFRHMADDMAMLVQKLGYECAHIIGHSSGGDIALVMLIEHPQRVQSAILQATHAFVSPDLLEKEPVIFDPARVERDSPGWMEEMIVLHGQTHGIGYWRELLRMTVQEKIHEPNYTPDALAKVESPVLAIQGEQDHVNSPARHAQFIAANIPYSELWIPKGIGHHVHKEIPFEWVARVEDFLDRRGVMANNSLYRLKYDHYSDPRSTIFEVRTSVDAQNPDQVILQGEVLGGKQLQHAVETLVKARPDKSFITKDVNVIIHPGIPWALVKRSVADLRREPHSLAERVSQALMGESVQILKTFGEWSHIRMERDGYLGWIHSAALEPCSREQAAVYQAACRVRVLADLLPARLHAEAASENGVGKLPFNVSLPVQNQTDSCIQVRLPDQQLWWVDSAGLLLLELWPAPNSAGIQFALDLVKRFIGVPYLWGGRSPFGFDCSGFAAAFWDFLGVTLPRDADQQYQAGQPIDGDPQAGDLLFFGRLAEEHPDERQKGRFASITHVAIALGNQEVIHANGTAWGVSYNSMNPESPRYSPWLGEHFVGARRYT